MTVTPKRTANKPVIVRCTSVHCWRSSAHFWHRDNVPDNLQVYILNDNRICRPRQLITTQLATAFHFATVCKVGKRALRRQKLLLIIVIVMSAGVWSKLSQLLWLWKCASDFVWFSVTLCYYGSILNVFHICIYTSDIYMFNKTTCLLTYYLL